MTHTTEHISPLRQRMIEDMTLRKLSPKTQRLMSAAVRNFTRFLSALQILPAPKISDVISCIWSKRHLQRQSSMRGSRAEVFL